MLVPSRTLYACKRKFLQCEATRSVESSITGVATNNYSMNFNYFATRGGGTGPRFPPLDPPLYAAYKIIQWDGIIGTCIHYCIASYNQGVMLQHCHTGPRTVCSRPSEFVTMYMLLSQNDLSSDLTKFLTRINLINLHTLTSNENYIIIVIP